MRSPVLDGLESFRRHRMVLADALVCPVWPMYLAYRRYCDELGFEPATGQGFLALLAREGVIVRQRETGSLRAVALGCGVTASDAHEARQTADSRGEKSRLIKAPIQVR